MIKDLIFINLGFNDLTTVGLKLSQNMFLWHLFWVTLRRLLKKYPRKYAMSWFQMSHVVLFLLQTINIFYIEKYDTNSLDYNINLFNNTCSLSLLQQAYKRLMYISISYFLYDNFGKPFPTIYTFHHIAAIASLLLIKTYLKRVFVMAMAIIELSNIPLYYAYGLRQLKTSKKQLEKYDNITFYFYIFCRLGLFIYPATRPITLTTLGTTVASSWYLFALVGAYGMYKKLI